ncbi:hypothetical protein ACCC88_15780 [Sphingomonas sp. Sphisp140]|uniref:hypothetical protein n=1 Tax=unclassified Sphingomonas TaxID=196159 RepID=UPI0039AEACEE
MGSFRQWATMIRHVHKTHTETGIEEEMGEELLALDAPKAPRERAERDTPASGGESCPL